MVADTSADDFLENVSEVSRLIEGLKAGTISPDYVDSKIAQKEQKAKKSAAPSSVTPNAEQDVVNQQQADAKRKDLARKVEELKANRARKERARKSYERYVSSGGASMYGTDYNKWGLWCPSDDEDDLFNSVTPNSPEFRALEKDIDDRHNRMVQQRQLAERQRVAGNAAFKAGQYSEALRCYQLGLESQRHSMTLHANAAMAALKLSCYVQALEHCDKVLHIAEVMHNSFKDPLCVKAYQRRAAAFKGLQQLDRAVQDLEAAHGLEPENAEVSAQLSRARFELEELNKVKALNKAMTKQTEPSQATGLPVQQLRQIEELCSALRPPETGGADATDPTLSCEQLASTSTALTGLLTGDDACCVYFRACGGVDHSVKQLGRLAHGAGATAAQVALLQLLNNAAHNDANLELLVSLGMLPRCLSLAGGSNAAAAAAAVVLLCTASTREATRRQLSQQLKQGRDAAHISNLVKLLSSTDASQKVAVLTVLGNCMVDKPCKDALQAAAQQQQADLLAALLQLLMPPFAGAASRTVVEKALVLVGNMCGDPMLRQLLAANQLLMQRLLLVALPAPAKRPPPSLAGSVATAVRSVAAAANDDGVQLAAATALYNLCMEPAAQQAVALAPKLQQLATLIRADGSPLSARAAGILARVAGCAAGAESLLKLPTLVQSLVKVLQTTIATTDTPASVAALVDASVRLLAALTARVEGAAALQAASGIVPLVQLIKDAKASDSTQGNAALCIGRAATDASILALLRKQQAVAALVGLAYRGKGNPASKNAAIALAKLAQDAAMLDQLRELHGLEIIYQYVKP